MSETPDELMTFPTTRPDDTPFDPHPTYALLDARVRAQGGLPKVTCPAKIDAYLVTGYHDTRAVLSNPNTSARAGTSGHSRLNYNFDEAPRPGSILQLDGEAHARIRRMLIPEFSVPSMKAMRPYIARIVDEHITALLAKGPDPVDFVEEFAIAIPALVIAELLDVPVTDRADFQHWGQIAMDIDNDMDDVVARTKPMVDYMTKLCVEQAQRPTEKSLIGRLVVKAQGDLSIQELVELSMILLVAGHDTTANMIALGTLALLENPQQLALLREDPELADSAVEELMRYLSIIQYGILREATADITLRDVTIKSGEWIIAALSAANRDPDVFTEPDRIDLARKRIGGEGQLGFGFGAHQCLGQNLARVELAEVFIQLYSRIPTLRLAVPLGEVELKKNLVYGPKSMQVTWDS